MRRFLHYFFSGQESISRLSPPFSGHAALMEPYKICLPRSAQTICNIAFSFSDMGEHPFEKPWLIKRFLPGTMSNALVFGVFRFATCSFYGRNHQP